MVAPAPKASAPSPPLVATPHACPPARAASSHHATPPPLRTPPARVRVCVRTCKGDWGWGPAAAAAGGGGGGGAAAMADAAAGAGGGEEDGSVRELDKYLPTANIARIMKKVRFFPFCGSCGGGGGGAGGGGVV